MIRVMGAVLVAAGAAWIGFQAAAGLRRRVRALEEMAAGLALLERDLELTGPPLPQLLARGGARGQGPARALFLGCAQGMDKLAREDFSALWRRQLGLQEELGPEGQAILSPLGDTLGRYDSARQGEALSAARRRLEELSARLGEDSRRQCRVYQALGLSGGAFLVILLL